LLLPAVLFRICLGILFLFISDPFLFFLFVILSWIHSFVHCPTFSQRVAALAARTIRILRWSNWANAEDGDHGRIDG
jgi:hypothetical protein